MKKVLSFVLMLAMVASLFAINVLAAEEKEILFFEQDFENIEENPVMANEAYVAVEAEGSDNHVLKTELGKIDPGWVDYEDADIFEGVKFEFRLMTTNAESRSFCVEFYNGDRVDTNSNGYMLITDNFTPNVWYDIEIVMQGGANNDSNVVAVATNSVTGEKFVPGKKIGCASTNKDTNGTTDTSDDILNAYKRWRFLGYVYTHSGTIDRTNSATMPFDWMVDDVKVYKLDEGIAAGTYMKHDPDDAGDSWFQLGNKRVWSGDSNRGYIMELKGGTGAYSELAKTGITDAAYLAPIGTEKLFIFDICKKAASTSIGIHLGEEGGGSTATTLALPANQMREDVWYTYAIVADAKRAEKVYRKVCGTDTWTQLRNEGDGAGAVLEKVTPESTADVADPVFLGNAGTGSSDAKRYRIMFSVIASAKHQAGWDGTANGYDADFGEGVTVSGSYIQVDNIRVVAANSARTWVTKAEDGAINAEVFVTENRPNNTTESYVMLAAYDSEGRAVAVDHAIIDNGTVNLSIDATAAASAASAKIFVWDADCETVVPEVIDITDKL